MSRRRQRGNRHEERPRCTLGARSRIVAVRFVVPKSNERGGRCAACNVVDAQLQSIHEIHDKAILIVWTPQDAADAQAGVAPSPFHDRTSPASEGQHGPDQRRERADQVARVSSPRIRSLRRRRHRKQCGCRVCPLVNRLTCRRRCHCCYLCRCCSRCRCH